jgi:hypothetical protein
MLKWKLKALVSRLKGHGSITVLNDPELSAALAVEGDEHHRAEGEQPESGTASHQEQLDYAAKVAQRLQVRGKRCSLGA